LEGEAQARVLQQQIHSYQDPRLYAVSLVAKNIAQSRQPLVPEQLFVNGSSGGDRTDAAGNGPLAMLLQLLLAEKMGYRLDGQRGESSGREKAASAAAATSGNNGRDSVTCTPSGD
jgi:hypothetical protein